MDVGWHLSSGYRHSMVIGVDGASAYLRKEQSIHEGAVAFVSVNGEAGQARYLLRYNQAGHDRYFRMGISLIFSN